MTILTQWSTLVVYDYVRSVDCFFGKDFVEVRAYEVPACYEKSEKYKGLGCYKDPEVAQAAIRGIADALEDGEVVYRMPQS